MAYISGSGTSFAARTAALAPSLWLLLCAAPLLAASNPPEATDLVVNIDGLRNGKGEVRLCLTQDGADFLDCRKHDDAVTREFPASAAGPIEFRGLPTGEWYLLVLHDENGNAKLDKMLGIPREGFGFSNNPKLRMGPPKARDVRFSLAGGEARQHVKLRYLL